MSSSGLKEALWNIIFPLSVVDGIMGGGLLLCMNSCMFARIYVGPISLYMCVGVQGRPSPLIP